MSAFWDEIRERIPVRKIGIANVNTIPHVIYADIEKGARGAQIVPAEEIILDLRAYKSAGEIELLREGYRITEEALQKTWKSSGPACASASFWRIGRRCPLKWARRGSAIPAG